MLHLLEQEDGAAREDGLGARRHDRRDEARQLANPNDVIEAPAANENPYGETLVHWATLGLSAFPLPLNLVDF
jgi:hypothetical protein